MRSIILIGMIATLSAVLCKDHLPYHRQNLSQRRYKDSKNKRGVGDYPFGGIPFSGPAFSGFHAPPPSVSAISPYAQSFPSYGVFGGGSPLGIAPSQFGLTSQPSPSFSALGSASLAGLGTYSNLGQIGLGQNSGYSLPSSSVNLASLLGGQASSPSTYSVSSGGLFTSSDAIKNVPITYGSQSSTSPQHQQQYMPVYATGTSLGSSSYNMPVVLGASHGSSFQGYSLPSSLNSLSSQGLSISSLSGGNGLTYSNPSSASSAPDSSSAHSVTSSYVVTAAPSQQNHQTSASYSIPISSLPSSSSSSSYSISLPVGYPSISSHSNTHSSPTNYQIPITSAYSTSPPSSSSTMFGKYTPTSLEESSYASKDQSNAYSAILKLTNLGSSSSNVASAPKPSFSSSGYTSSGSSSSNHPITSYGTPVMTYDLPSTSYGTPSNSQLISSSSHSSQSMPPSINYNNAASSSRYPSYSTSHSSHKMHPSMSYNSPSSSSFSSSSSSPLYQMESLHKGSTNSRLPLASSYSEPSVNYDSSNSIPSHTANSVMSLKSQMINPTSTLSNSIENYSSSSHSNQYDHGPDSGSSYSNNSPRYLRYQVDRPSPYIENDDSASDSSYDTISYSVPSGKY